MIITCISNIVFYDNTAYFLGIEYLFCLGGGGGYQLVLFPKIPYLLGLTFIQLVRVQITVKMENKTSTQLSTCSKYNVGLHTLCFQEQIQTPTILQIEIGLYLLNWQTVSMSDRQKAICIDIAVSVKSFCQIERQVCEAEFTLYKKFDR